MKHPKINQQRIIFVTRMILIVVAISVGASVFYIMKNHAQNLLRTSLQTALHNHVVLTQSEIRQAFEKTATVATRPFLIKQINEINERQGLDPAAQAALQRGAESFLMTGLSAIAIYDQKGQKIAQAGTFTEKPVLEVPIHFASNMRLLYAQHYYLRAEMNIDEDGRTIGKVVTETPLSVLNTMFIDTTRQGTTSDLALCAPEGTDRMLCFPTTLHPHTMDLSFNASPGTPLPMSYALKGETGFVIAHDYRHQEVVAAYSPVGHLGLGMVLKIDSAELYAPVWQQLRYLLPLMALMIAFALLALKWLLSPLVFELVRSERETRHAYSRLRDSENHVRLLLENADEGIISINADGTIEIFNPAAERIFQYARADAIGKNISILMPEPFASEHDHYVQHYLQTGERHVIGSVRELEGRRRDGTTFPMELRVSEFKLQDQRKFIGIMHDITERKAIESKIVHLAHYDALTDLPNRRLVQDRIEQSIARVQRTKSQFAVMFIDLNKFKSVNDTLGHDVGDILLKTVAQRLTGTLRAEDTVGRQSGDEFIVVLANISAPDDPGQVAQKIIAALLEPVEIHGQFLQPSASIGIAVYPKDGEDVETLIKHSDKAMYLAKDMGSSTYRFYTQAKTQPKSEE
ncbi:MAG: diguanylate cyclase domain-containing protein [Halothiobacillus sp.]